ncbi:hypothetical protein Peur_014580 [Populus x canadensis]
MLFSSSPPPPLLRVNSLYTAKPPFTDSMGRSALGSIPSKVSCPLLHSSFYSYGLLTIAMAMLYEMNYSAGGSTASPSQRGQVKSRWKIWEQQKFSFSVSTSSFSG